MELVLQSSIPFRATTESEPFLFFRRVTVALYRIMKEVSFVFFRILEMVISLEQNEEPAFHLWVGA